LEQGVNSSGQGVKSGQGARIVDRVSTAQDRVSTAQDRVH